MEVIAQLITIADTTDATLTAVTTNATCAADATFAAAKTNATYAADATLTVRTTNVTLVVDEADQTSSISMERTMASTAPLSIIRMDVSMNTTGSTPIVGTMTERPVILEPAVMVLSPTEEPTMPVRSFPAGQSTLTKGGVISGSGVTGTSVVANEMVGVGPPLAAEKWVRDAQMVEGIFRIMEGMEPPWVTLDVLEAATVRFPTVDRKILRRTIMTVMMTQRRCVVRLTRAGLRRGPRTDRDGNSFVELDLDYADRFACHTNVNA